MLKSMTGFGKAVCELPSKKISVEIKSLNSKQLDLNTKIPQLYREKEYEIRTEISNRLSRGKVDFAINIEQTDLEKTSTINKPVVESYIKQLKEIAENYNVELSEALISSAFKFPDSFKSEKEELSENEWQSVKETINLAINELDKFRNQEGKALEKDIIGHINQIMQLLKNVDNFDKLRTEKIRTRLRNNLNEFITSENIDQNRFEQEIIYYLEKFDINEEKVRLSNHCKYFEKVINEEDFAGKKLGFISQEIGREINTLGSKANDSDLQIIVIQMKDELEKIKEQLLNAL
ncbi:MAG: YicC family protein [Bacteroidales bacterium]|nr:YicC family protein [Bacteroidales bacterium]